MYTSHPTRFGNIVERHRPELGEFEEHYCRIHADPEIAGQEAHTADRVLRFLEGKNGIEVISGIGGHGVVGVVRHGDGPVVLLRAEMDALPMKEKTGLPYASRKTTKDSEGAIVPVFHGCGHDMHVACLMAATQLLLNAGSHWSGTLISLFQPAEEDFTGAKAMVDDRLYEQIPIPDILLAQHTVKEKAGTVSLAEGAVLTACESLDITIHGRGGHGSSPDSCLDPIVVGAHALVRLQTIVSREISPRDFAVVTCGSFRAGSTASIIPDSAKLRVDMRAYKEEVMDKLRTSVKRVVKAECKASGLTEQPDIKHTRGAPPTTNDNRAAALLEKSFKAFFGKDCQKMQPDTASEDFSPLAQPNSTPYVYWDFGTIDPDKWDQAKSKNELGTIPGNHSIYFAPAIEPTLKTGTDAMALAALTFLSPRHDEKF